MKTKILLSLLFLTFTGHISFSQNINKPRLDSLLDILARNNKAMVSVVIAKDGNPIYSKSTGYASITDSQKIPATDDTRYRIGSITKTFTSTMIFQLIEEGKLKLNTTLDRFFPTIPNAKTITISSLLNHRSGIHNFTSDSAYVKYMTSQKKSEEMVAIIAATNPDFQPNEKAAYSNSNYVLLGFIIEKITGKSYAENLSARIAKKLQLNETYVGGKTDPKKNESYSYAFDKTWKQLPETDMSIPAGAGSVLSTPADLTKFITALFSNKLVSASSLNQMKTITDGYGMGLFQVPYGAKKGYGHGGNIDGFASSLYYFPEDGVAASICANSISYPMNDILIAVLGSYYGVPFAMPTFTSIQLKSEDLDKYLGVYSSIQLPIKITISKNNNTLTAQATGQPSFSLDAAATDVFKFEQAGIVIEFRPAKSEFILKQGGGNFLFTKDK